MDKARNLRDACDLLRKCTREGGRVVLLSPEDYEMVEASIKDTHRFCYRKWVDAGIDHVLYGPWTHIPFVRVDHEAT